MADNAAVVRDFIAAWSRLDVEELVGFFTEDGVYHNMPLRVVQGHAGRALHQGFHDQGRSVGMVLGQPGFGVLVANAVGWGQAGDHLPPDAVDDQRKDAGSAGKGHGEGAGGQ